MVSLRDALNSALEDTQSPLFQPAFGSAMVDSFAVLQESMPMVACSDTKTYAGVECPVTPAIVSAGPELKPWWQTLPIVCFVSW